MSKHFTGEIRMFSGNFAPQGWAFCDGQLLPIGRYQSLFSLIGTTYGGDGQTAFMLPNLQGRSPMHRGNGKHMGQTGAIDLTDSTLSQSLRTEDRETSLAPGHLAMNFVISLGGIYPSVTIGELLDPFVGEGRIFAFDFAPKGWAHCDGQLLPIDENQALFSLLGTTYGGDSRLNFALPDLRGSIPMHTGGHVLGDHVAVEESAESLKKESIGFLVLNSCIGLQRDALEIQDASSSVHTGTCPECDADIEVDFDAEKGDLASCEECGIDLEIVDLDPLQFDLVVDDDNGEDDEEDEY